MTYTVTITMTLPKDKAEWPDGGRRQIMQQARQQAVGFIGEERSFDDNTCTVTHVWESKQAYDDYRRANRDLIRSRRAAAKWYRDRHNIEASVAKVNHIAAGRDS